ncbi:cellulose binding domain-containing protein [Sphaerisporangium aureirubrum]|uniref:Cellulose binding domain-containing protein n=1 Tax=Sphaerisporangium aureirubrum TaxID=1544736 RepID=A0ABW1NME0_9ACTN
MKRKLILRLLVGAALVAAALGGSPLAAHAATPLPAPTNVQAVHVADTSADLWWLRDGASAQDVVERKVGAGWREYARGLFGQLALTGLTPGTTYTFRVYSIPVSGLGYTTSARSAPVSFTTLPGPDTVPPSTPAMPTFSTVTTTAADIFWPESTDNVQVTGYHLQQLVDGVWTNFRTVGPGGRFQSVYGLSPGTSYSYAVIAFDARGNESARSATGVLTTLPATATPSCRTQVIPYNPGFTANVTIVNTTTAPIVGWTVRFTLPAAAAAAGVFNGVLTRTGDAATLTPVSYTNVIQPGGQFTVGFSGSARPFTPPSGFTFEGVPCTS